MSPSSLTATKRLFSSLSSRATPPTTRAFHFFQRKSLNSSTTFNMPAYIITCKDDASHDDVASAKQAARDQGGEITHEYNLIKGFAVKFPEGSVHSMETHEHVKAVEADQEVRTQ